jgi:hypothetical protein
MSERWIPVVAAVLGVLGGMGGAFIGGNVANEGQEKRFEDEQAVRAGDLRRGAYAHLLEEAAAVQFAVSPKGIDRLTSAEAKADLFANSEVRDAAQALVDAVKDVAECTAADCYERAQARFIDAAKAQLGIRE